MPAGRPKKYTKKRLKEIEEEINAYTENTTLPVLAECAYKLGMHRQQLYEFPELNDAIKKLITKKEAVLEKGGLTGRFNATMSIFSLKQIGWRDQPVEPYNTSNEHDFEEALSESAATLWAEELEKRAEEEETAE